MRGDWGQSGLVSVQEPENSAALVWQCSVLLLRCDRSATGPYMLKIKIRLQKSGKID